MEAPIEKTETPRSELPIEQQANFEGSWTNLMLERVKDPEIFKQMVDLLSQLEFPSTPEDIAYVEGQIERQKERQKRLIKNPKLFAGFECTFVVPKQETHEEIREAIIKELQKKIETISLDTPISWGGDVPSGDRGPQGREIINLCWKKDGEKEVKTRQWNIIESHEKGHQFRCYDKRFGNFYDKYILGEKFWGAFDFIAVNDLTEDVFHLNYLKNPAELAERMSQLKNYFGMKGDEKFTKEHLVYAREHYVKDTELDNSMTQFFQAITPEKEDAFIELINSSGI